MMTLEQLAPWGNLVFPAICAAFCYFIKASVFRQLAPLITELRLHRQIMDQQQEAMKRLTKTLETMWERMDQTRERITRVEAQLDSCTYCKGAKHD